MKIKKGDTVQVIAGKDKGARGKVIQAYPKTEKVLVEGVNRVKKHTRITQTQRGAQSGGIVTQEAPIHVSNVMVVDSDGKPSRRSNARPSSSVVAVVTTVMSMPRGRSMVSGSISWNIDCSLSPNV